MGLAFLLNARLNS